MKFFILLLLLYFGYTTDGYKILGLFSHPGKSHFEVFQPLLRKLAERGHELTIISHFPQQTPIKNYKDISLAGTDEFWYANIDVEELPRDPLSEIITPLIIGAKGVETCKNTISSKPIQDFLASKNLKFDIIIMELFNTDCFMSIVHKVKAPLIGISSCELMPWTYSAYGSPNIPSFMGSVFIGSHDKMNFLQRTVNTISTLFSYAAWNFYMEKKAHQFGLEYVDKNLPPLWQISHNSSIIIVNTHYSLNGPKPHQPNFIEVGGIHIGTPKPLTGKLEKFVNESKAGVIYFSMGSMIKGHTFPEDKRRMFQRAFARLPQRVLWKFEDEGSVASDGIMAQKWMPQLDVLCHPNVKAFITHGGLLGTTEAVHCGVPMVVMPHYGDQHRNAKAVENSGGGVILQYTSLTEDKIYEALQTVLTPKYQAQAKDLSARFKDRPQSPMDTAVYWVEYVGRHKGAKFMRSPGLDLAWYQYYLLDVTAFLLAIIYILYKFNMFLVKKLLKICRKSPKKQKSS